MKKKEIIDPTSLRFSIIIPVLHESQTINILIDHLHHLQASDTSEIIVVDGSTTLDTLNVIKTPDVRCIVAEQGRATQMNAGAAVAQGRILIFLHADTHLPDNALPAIQKALQQNGCVGGAFAVGFSSEKYLFKSIALTGTMRSRFTKIPFGDQAIFLRNTYFTQLGGYANLPLFEDIDLMRRIRKAKGMITILPEQITTSPRRFEEGGVVSTVVKNIVLVIMFYCGISPHRLRKWYL